MGPPNNNLQKFTVCNVSHEFFLEVEAKKKRLSPEQEPEPSCSTSIIDSKRSSSLQQEQPNNPLVDVDIGELLKKSAREQFELLRIREERLRMQEERLKTLEQMAMLRDLAGLDEDSDETKQDGPTPININIMDLESIKAKELPKAKPVRYDVCNPMMGSYQKSSIHKQHLQENVHSHTASTSSDVMQQSASYIRSGMYGGHSSESISVWEQSHKPSGTQRGHSSEGISVWEQSRKASGTHKGHSSEGISVWEQSHKASGTQRGHSSEGISVWEQSSKASGTHRGHSSVYERSIDLKMKRDNSIEYNSQRGHRLDYADQGDHCSGYEWQRDSKIQRDCTADHDTQRAHNSEYYNERDQHFDYNIDQDQYYYKERRPSYSNEGKIKIENNVKNAKANIERKMHSMERGNSSNYEQGNSRSVFRKYAPDPWANKVNVWDNDQLQKVYSSWADKGSEHSSELQRYSSFNENMQRAHSSNEYMQRAHSSDYKFQRDHSSEYKMQRDHSSEYELQRDHSSDYKMQRATSSEYNKKRPHATDEESEVVHVKFGREPPAERTQSDRHHHGRSRDIDYSGQRAQFDARKNYGYSKK